MREDIIRSSVYLFNRSRKEGYVVEESRDYHHRRDYFDEAYPEAISLFDHLLRYATSQGFEPQFEMPQEQLRRFRVQ